jgi:hypothetical protein
VTEALRHFDRSSPTIADTHAKIQFQSNFDKQLDQIDISEHSGYMKRVL